MGLISKEVEIGLMGKDVKHYEDKGYIIPRRKDKHGRLIIPRDATIIVNVEDLTDGCGTVRVKVKCDECGEIKSMSWSNYKKGVKENNKYYCNKCSKKLFGIEKMKKTLLQKHGKSFYDWCLENNRFDVLLRWDYELNMCSPQDVTYKSLGFDKKGYYFKCSRNIHPSEQKRISDFTNGHEGVIDCILCNSFAQWGIDNIDDKFLELYWDCEKNQNINPWKISYGSKKKVYIICQEKDYHESSPMTPNNFVNGSRCQYCCNHKGKVHPFDSLGYYIINKYGEEFLNKIWSDKNKKSPFEHSPSSNQYAYFKCLDGKHDDTKRSISNTIRCNFRCPKCMEENDSSILQTKVDKYLHKLGYNVLHEYDTLRCINPKTKYPLPYDNEIKELHFILEINGIQHYSITNFHQLSAKKMNTTPEYELHRIQLHDRYKRMIAKSKGYEYIAIPYWTDNENEDWKLLINNKINEILEYKEVS